YIYGRHCVLPFSRGCVVRSADGNLDTVCRRMNAVIQAPLIRWPASPQRWQSRALGAGRTEAVPRDVGPLSIEAWRLFGWVRHSPLLIRDRTVRLLLYQLSVVNGYKIWNTLAQFRYVGSGNP